MTTSPGVASATGYEAVARNLEMLASPIRLAILGRLRHPAPLNLIRVEAPPEPGGAPRVLSRQAVSWHLNQLVDAGVVRRLPCDGRSPLYVLNHERLFALVDEMRDLSRLKPFAGPARPGETMDTDSEPADPVPDGPRLVLVYGRDEGTAFPLANETVLGRDPKCDVCLDYDAYASARHARLLRDGDGFRLQDMDSRNGTRVNGRELRSVESRALRPGDVVTVGRSHLVFQDG